MSEFKPGVFVRKLQKNPWYGVVFLVESRPEMPERASTWVTVATICTADGRPHRKVMRKRVKSHKLEVVDNLPERYDGPIPTTLPDPPTGTPRRKFTDSFEKGDKVWVTRYRHGWNMGEGTIVEISAYGCAVKLDGGGGCVIDIEHVRDLSGPY
jgi:hypothetical protein